MPPRKKPKTLALFKVSDVVVISSNRFPAQVISEETFRAAASEDHKSSIQSLKVFYLGDPSSTLSLLNSGAVRKDCAKHLTLSNVQTHLDKGAPEGSNSATAKKRKIYWAYQDAHNVLSTCSPLCHEGDKPSVEHAAELEPILENQAEGACKDNLAKLHAINHYRQEEEVFDTWVLDAGEGQCEVAADSPVPEGSHQDEKEVGGHPSDGDGRYMVEVDRDPPEKEKEAVNAWNLPGEGRCEVKVDLSPADNCHNRDLYRQEGEGKAVSAQDTDGEGETEVESDPPISEDDREDKANSAEILPKDCINPDYAAMSALFIESTIVSYL
ncbi:hypothetical protein BDP27DRAFT_1435267 [Rhodocollybia butyracea]|uniref:Uncharacterized protein n=1 Tax=Rhodocollybia butyracea TaxID=206335 RepID=A0A9P5TWG8_9AGAR|nr:hypothetical protein BDP27DRAFT_1435267 [Rhodocollybia butyracea]